MSEYNKYFLLYLTTNAQSRLELTDNYIQTYNYSGSSGFMGISTANSNQNPLGATVTALPCRQ